MPTTIPQHSRFRSHLYCRSRWACSEVAHCPFDRRQLLVGGQHGKVQPVASGYPGELDRDGAVASAGVEKDCACFHVRCIVLNCSQS